MKTNTQLLLCFFILFFSFNCSTSNSEIKEADNWVDYQQLVSANPSYMQELQKLASSDYQEYHDFDYNNFKRAKAKHLKEVKAFLESSNNDSLKLGAITRLLASGSSVNSKEKKLLFSKINTSSFSPELIEHYEGYLATPKFQIDDDMDVKSVYSYKEEKEMPLALDAELNIIFFWASWCVNCDRYYEPLEKLIDKYDKNQLNVIGISLDQKEKRMLKYEEKHGFKFESFCDMDPKWKSSNAKRFGVVGIPQCYVVSKEGKVLLANPEAHLIEMMVDNILMNPNTISLNN